MSVFSYLRPRVRDTPVVREASLFLLSLTRSLESRWRGVRFLLYHDIADKDRLSFERQLRFLKRHADFVSADQAVKLAEQSDTGRYFCVTFDDGYRSIASNAMPIMADLGIPGIVFVITGALEPHERGNRRYLSVEECRQLLANNISLGSHSVSHNRLPLLSETRALEEMSSSKRFLEETFGISCAHFACPGGAYQPGREPKLAREVGYRTLFTSTPGTLLNDSQLYECPRQYLEPNWGLYQLRYFLGG